MPSGPDRYTHGHHESVLRSHRWRSADNSAGFLLPSLRRGMSLLDVGCGPGTITADLASRLGDGSVLGVDASEEVIALARAEHAAGAAPPGAQLSFEVADVYDLRYPEASFDVVYAHQVLQHLTRPSEAVASMRRVLRPGGTLAVRDSDYGAFVWSPADPVLDRWMELYHAVTRRNGAQADAGRNLCGWVRAGGFDDLTVSSSTWTFHEPAERAWWGGLWADRMVDSDLARQAVDYGLSDPSELQVISNAFRRWAQCPEGVFVVLHGEVLARA